MTQVGGDEETVPDKYRQLDWEELRRLSLEPGGFGEGRIRIWPQLLHIPPTNLNSDRPYVQPEASEQPHETGESIDEFSHCRAASSSTSHRDERQIQLDTERSFVLYPVDATSRTTLQTELHQLLLAVFRKRPKLSYFQGYHDVVSVIFLTLPSEMQLICVEKLSLHRVRDSMGATLEPVLGLLRILKNVLRLADPSFASLLERNSPLPYYALSNLLTLFSHDMPTLPLIQHVFDFLLCRPPIAVVYLAAAIVLSRRQEVERLQQEGEEGMVHSLLSGMPDITDDTQVASTKEGHSIGAIYKLTEVSKQSQWQVTLDDVYEPLEPCDGQYPGIMNDGPKAGLATLSDSSLKEESPDPQGPPLLSPQNESIIPTPRLTLETPHHPDSEENLQEDEKINEKQSKSPTPPPLLSLYPRRPNLTLTSLLVRADELYSLYPPNHQAITVSSIMGPQSVAFTWSENLAEMPDDDEAEMMVQKPELIVRPYIEPDTEDKEGDDEIRKDNKIRRKLQKSPRFGGITIQRRTLLAGAVLVLGVGLAVYGIRARSLVTMGNVNHGKVNGWKRMRTWIGEALAGVISGSPRSKNHSVKLTTSI